jgi:hypothetical protein
MSDPATKEDLKDLREFILITPTHAPTPSIEQSIWTAEDWQRFHDSTLNTPVVHSLPRAELVKRRH